MAAASPTPAPADLDACRRQQGVGQTGYSTAVSTDYVSPENRRAAQFAREDFRGLTIADVER